MSSKHQEHEAVFVILRVDLFQAKGTPLETMITATQVVHSHDLAEQEVSRLNAMHADGKVHYWYTHSRLFPPGRSASSVAEPA